MKSNELPDMTPQQRSFVTSSSLSSYKDLVAKDLSWISFLYFELGTLFLSGLPGLFGMGMRNLCYPPMFAKCGKRPAIGRGMLLRNTKHISLGNKVIVDDYTTLDAHGDGSAITLEDYVCLGRFSSIVAKGAKIRLKQGVNIGSYCRLATQSYLEVGESTLIAAYCYIGPGNHTKGTEDTPLISQRMEVKGGVKIGSHVWIGARATILDGVEIGDGAIVGAHSLVKDSVAPGVTVVGVPARVVS